MHLRQNADGEFEGRTDVRHEGDERNLLEVNTLAAVVRSLGGRVSKG